MFKFTITPNAYKVQGGCIEESHTRDSNKRLLPCRHLNDRSGIYYVECPCILGKYINRFNPH